MVDVFAHQGGWDEILFVAIPMILVALLLRLANRRAVDSKQQTTHGPPESD